MPAIRARPDTFAAMGLGVPAAPTRRWVGDLEAGQKSARPARVSSALIHCRGHPEYSPGDRREPWSINLPTSPHNKWR